MTILNDKTLAQLGPGIARPGYDRHAVSTGIAHIGLGNFHRAHQAMYLDTLMNQGEALDWGIAGVGLQPSNVGVRDVLAAQDGLYTLVLRHGDGAWDARVIGSLTGYQFAPDDPGAVIERLAAPATRIVSLTVTEGGYNLDAVTGQFNEADPAVRDDLDLARPPRTVFGVVTEALARRRARGLPAFTVMSCDNIQGNGHTSRHVFTAFARIRDPALAEWIEDNGRFPNSMVDRITPQATEADRAELASRFGIEDQWPVLCEPFTQWVLEDDFSAGRPPLEDAGVQIVADVEPYELMKLRLLNASHQALCYPGYLVGHRLVHEVTTDPLFARFLLDYMTQEAIPTLRPVPGIDLEQYAHQLIERFSNPEVGDTLTRLCAGTSDLIPKFLLPVVRAQLAAGRPFTRAAAVVASWARYAEGTEGAAPGPPSPTSTATPRRKEPPMNDFDGKVILVTGAAGGIGGATVSKLAARGATVIAAGRKESDLAAIAGQTGARPLAFDLTSEESVAGALGGLDVWGVVNCGGWGGEIATPQDTDIDVFDKVIAVNARGALLVTKYAARSMIRLGRGGAIVNVSSQASLVALAGHISYGSSKAALDNITRVSALELGSHGIRVNSVNPTVVMTPMSAWYWGRPEVEGPFLEQMPLHRWATEDDIAGPIAFLLSDEAAMISGVSLPIDGGYTSR